MNNLESRVREANVRLIVDGNIESIADHFSANYIVNLGSTTKSGHGAVRGFMKAIHSAFSGLSVDVEILVETDDRLSWLRTIRGTQTGPFQGFPSSGLEISWHDMVVSRFEGGRIAEEWVVTDLAEALLRSRKH